MRPRHGIIVALITTLLVPVGIGVARATEPPANDNFADAVLVGALPFDDAVTTSGATEEKHEPEPGCGPIGRTVWYRFTPDTDTEVRVDTAGSDFDTMVAVYTGGNVPSLKEVACNDDPGGGGLQAEVTFSATSGETYHLQFGGFVSKSGFLEVAIGPAPASNTGEDTFADSADIAPLPFHDETDTRGFTTETDEPQPSCGFDSAATAWYQFTPEENVQVIADTFGSDYDTVLAVYRGTNFGDLVQVACNDDSFSAQSQVLFSAEAGVEYHFQVGEFSSPDFPGGGGSLRFNVSEPEPPLRSSTARYVGQSAFVQSGPSITGCSTDVNVGGVCFDLEDDEAFVTIDSATDDLTGKLAAVLYGFSFGGDPIGTPFDLSCVPGTLIPVPPGAAQFMVWTFDPVFTNLFGVGSCGASPALATTGEITVSFFAPVSG